MSRMVELTTEYGRSGYRRITALLQAAGWRGGRPSHQVAEGAQIEVEFFAFEAEAYL